MPSKMQKLSLLTKIDLKFKIFLTFCVHFVNKMFSKMFKNLFKCFFYKKNLFSLHILFYKMRASFLFSKKYQAASPFYKVWVFAYILFSFDRHTFCVHFVYKMFNKIHLELQNRQKQILVFRFLKKINSLESAQNIFLHLYFTEKIYDPYFSIDSSCSCRRIFSISRWCPCSFCISWWLDTKQRYCFFWT